MCLLVFNPNSPHYSEPLQRVFLDGEGFDQVLNMLGEMSAWTYETVTGAEEQEECSGESCLDEGSWGSIKAFFR